jgi:CDP-paratose 2-epimerase
MRYLITGGCGFLGSSLAAEALRRGGELWVLDNLYRVGTSANLEWLRGLGSFEFFQADIRTPAEVRKAVEASRPAVIFHVAGQVAMTTSLADPRLDFEVNAVGTFNLIEAVRGAAPGAAVIYSSTNKVYGDLEWVRYEETATRYVTPDFPNGFDETTPLHFHSPYGCSKGAADQYLLDSARVFGLNTVVFRHSSIYGGRQFATFDQGWVGWFCQKALEQRSAKDAPTFTIAGNGKQVRDVLHVEDAVRAYFAAAEEVAHVRGLAFNIGGTMANSLSLVELFSLLEELLDVRLRFEQQAPRVSDQKVFVADTSSVFRALGWKPEVSARDGIRRMLDWLQGLPPRD